MKTIPAVHFCHPYLLAPTNPITVNLIGAGGTGSHVLAMLGKINHALLALEKPGLFVTLFDDDRVTTANPGRQNFADSEIGLYKSVALINRANSFFGTNWQAIPKKFERDRYNWKPRGSAANLYISCVDKVSPRFEIEKIISSIPQNAAGPKTPLYWMDFGNSRSSGQATLATITPVKQPTDSKFPTQPSLPMITKEYRIELKKKKEDDQPSCSLAEALLKQDLFINMGVGVMGAHLLWQLLTQPLITNRGFFLNLDTLRCMPVPISTEKQALTASPNEA